MSPNVVQNGVQICRLRRTASSDTAKTTAINNCWLFSPPTTTFPPLTSPPLASFVVARPLRR